MSDSLELEDSSVFSVFLCPLMGTCVGVLPFGGLLIWMSLLVSSLVPVEDGGEVVVGVADLMTAGVETTVVVVTLLLWLLLFALVTDNATD